MMKKTITLCACLLFSPLYSAAALLYTPFLYKFDQKICIGFLKKKSNEKDSAVVKKIINSLKNAHNKGHSRIHHFEFLSTSAGVWVGIWNVNTKQDDLNKIPKDIPFYPLEKLKAYFKEKSSPGKGIQLFNPLNQKTRIGEEPYSDKSEYRFLKPAFDKYVQSLGADGEDQYEDRTTHTISGNNALFFSLGVILVGLGGFYYLKIRKKHEK